RFLIPPPCSSPFTLPPLHKMLSPSCPTLGYSLCHAHVCGWMDVCVCVCVCAFLFSFFLCSMLFPTCCCALPFPCVGENSFSQYAYLELWGGYHQHVGLYDEPGIVS
ncbi:unnamed protein product, partial [Discosporangium mesarthrocarpum]